MRNLLASVLLLLLIAAGIVQGATPIQRTVIGNQVHVIYLVEADHAPVVTAGDSYITSRTLVQDRQQWRLTINATLPLCSGELAIDGQRVTSQRCVYFPVGVR